MGRVTFWPLVCKQMPSQGLLTHLQNAVPLHFRSAKKHVTKEKYMRSFSMSIVCGLGEFVQLSSTNDYLASCFLLLASCFFG